MPLGFAAIPNAPAYRLAGARAPLALVTSPGLAADRDGFATLDITVAEGRIASVMPAGTSTLDGDLPAVDLDGGIMLPRFVDIHTHLDKSHIWPRCANPDGTFMAALEHAAADRDANWSADDLRARMAFSLRCALAHGSGALRTHLDSLGAQTAITWPVFAEVRERWAGRVALQGVALAMPEHYRGEAGERLADRVQEHGGLLGLVPQQAPALDQDLDRFLALAPARGLDVDLHVDETGDPSSDCLRHLAQAVLRRRFPGRVVAGHCC